MNGQIRDRLSILLRIEKPILYQLVWDIWPFKTCRQIWNIFYLYLLKINFISLDLELPMSFKNIILKCSRSHYYRNISTTFLYKPKLAKRPSINEKLAQHFHFQPFKVPNLLVLLHVIIPHKILIYGSSSFQVSTGRPQSRVLLFTLVNGNSLLPLTVTVAKLEVSGNKVSHPGNPQNT